MKWAAAGPVYAVMAARGVKDALAAAAGETATGEVYRRLGVRPFINARGTWTYLSGSLELPEVRRAMDDAAHHFVDIFELQKAAGRKLAQLSGAESGMVTSGAAGAMAAATAGCMAGADPEKVWRLPDASGMKNEVVMLGGRSAFDSAIRLTGAKLVLIRDLEDLPGALSGSTAMVYTTWLGKPLEAALAITKKAGVPLAAACGPGTGYRERVWPDGAGICRHDLNLTVTLRATIDAERRGGFALPVRRRAVAVKNVVGRDVNERHRRSGKRLAPR
jgi:L-seryl-tRNA(Ser) seleniumtransferase